MPPDWNRKNDLLIIRVGEKILPYFRKGWEGGWYKTFTKRQLAIDGRNNVVNLELNKKGEGNFQEGKKKTWFFYWKAHQKLGTLKESCEDNRFLRRKPEPC